MKMYALMNPGLPHVKSLHLHGLGPYSNRRFWETRKQAEDYAEMLADRDGTATLDVFEVEVELTLKPEPPPYFEDDLKP